ncbi:MAG: hypothetical protein K8R36_21155 [Planctomycetales bacterium]|nr:hypothetical protein [Planctomycetales bacterium]
MPDTNYSGDVTNLSPAMPIQRRPVAGESRSRLWIWLSILAIGFTLLNLLYVPIIVATAPPPGPVPVMPSLIVFYLFFFSLGAITAEPGLLAIAAVFGPGIAWHRHLAVFVLLIVFTLSGAVSIFLAEWIVSQNLIYGARMNLPFTLHVPILFYICQVPLWLFRGLFRWRMAHVEQGKLEKAPRLSIAGILAATAVIALALGAVRLGPFLFQKIQPSAKVDIHMLWFLIGIWAVAVFAISITALPVFTLAIFRMRPLLLGVVVALIWSALVFATAITIYRGVNGGWPFPFSWHVLAALVLGFTVSLIVPLIIVRLHGYQLLWGRGS